MDNCRLPAKSAKPICTRSGDADLAGQPVAKGLGYRFAAREIFFRDHAVSFLSKSFPKKGTVLLRVSLMTLQNEMAFKSIDERMLKMIKT